MRRRRARSRRARRGPRAARRARPAASPARRAASEQETHEVRDGDRLDLGAQPVERVAMDARQQRPVAPFAWRDFGARLRPPRREPAAQDRRLRPRGRASAPRCRAGEPERRASAGRGDRAAEHQAAPQQLDAARRSRVHARAARDAGRLHLRRRPRNGPRAAPGFVRPRSRFARPCGRQPPAWRGAGRRSVLQSAHARRAGGRLRTGTPPTSACRAARAASTGIGALLVAHPLDRRLVQRAEIPGRRQVLRPAASAPPAPAAPRAGHRRETRRASR